MGETKDVFLVNLRFIMSELKMNDAELAARLELSPQAVSKTLNKSGDITTGTIDKIAKALNLSGPDMCSKEFRIKYLSQKQ